MKTNARFIKSVIDASNKEGVNLPWSRGTRRAAFIAKRAALTSQQKSRLKRVGLWPGGSRAAGDPARDGRVPVRTDGLRPFTNILCARASLARINPDRRCFSGG